MPLSEEMTPANRTWRQLLWLYHGHTGLYGDDGEMQCGGADFLRNDPQSLLAHIAARADTDALRARVAALEGALDECIRWRHEQMHRPRPLLTCDTDWCQRMRAALAAPPVSPAPNSHQTPASAP